MTPLGLLFTSSRVVAAVYKILLTLIMIYILLKDFNADDNINKERTKYQRSKPYSGGAQPPQ